MPSAREAVDGADLICTVTAAREPVLLGEWIAPGAHINAAGAWTPNARELDAAAVARSRLFTDRRESLLAEAGDFLLARGEGAVTDDHILGEIGEVLEGQDPRPPRGRGDHPFQIPGDRGRGSRRGVACVPEGAGGGAGGRAVLEGPCLSLSPCS